MTASLRSFAAFRRRAEATVLAIGGLAVHEQAEALLEGELGVGGRLELFLERPGHAAEAEGLELVDGGVDEHGSSSSLVVGGATHVGVDGRWS